MKFTITEDENKSHHIIGAHGGISTDLPSNKCR